MGQLSEVALKLQTANANIKKLETEQNRLAAAIPALSLKLQEAYAVYNNLEKELILAAIATPPPTLDGA